MAKIVLCKNGFPLMNVTACSDDWFVEAVVECKECGQCCAESIQFLGNSIGRSCTFCGAKYTVKNGTKQAEEQPAKREKIAVACENIWTNLTQAIELLRDEHSEMFADSVVNHLEVVILQSQHIMQTLNRK